MNLNRFKFIITFFTLFFGLFFFFSADQAFAKALTLSATNANVEVDKTFEVQVTIDTGGEKVNGIGFNIDFSTETLEGLTPNQAGSSFPMCAKLSATRYDCGAPGQDGFSGQGLVTTLLFRGRATGQTQVTLTNLEAYAGPTSAPVTGFSIGAASVTIYGKGEVPASSATDNSTATPETQPTTSATSNAAAQDTVAPTVQQPTTTQTPTVTQQPGTTKGSTPQVKGETGSQPEQPLQAATEQTPSVKGLFTSNNTLLISLLPSLLLLLLVGFLGSKLFFTEKRRHLDLERLFEKELGTLSTLESKLDLLDQKGEGNKEKVISEFETVKSEIVTEENANLSHSKL